MNHSFIPDYTAPPSRWGDQAYACEYCGLGCSITRHHTMSGRPPAVWGQVCPQHPEALAAKRAARERRENKTNRIRCARLNPSPRAAVNARRAAAIALRRRF